MQPTPANNHQLRSFALRESAPYRDANSASRINTAQKTMSTIGTSFQSSATDLVPAALHGGPLAIDVSENLDLRGRTFGFLIRSCRHLVNNRSYHAHPHCRLDAPPENAQSPQCHVHRLLLSDLGTCVMSPAYMG
jgi:hypothetical protein